MHDIFISILSRNPEGQQKNSPEIPIAKAINAKYVLDIMFFFAFFYFTPFMNCILYNNDETFCGTFILRLYFN